MLLKLLKRIFGRYERTYNSALEEYIVANNPQSTADVERLTKQYDLAIQKGFFV